MSEKKIKQAKSSPAAEGHVQPVVRLRTKQDKLLKLMEKKHCPTHLPFEFGGKKITQEEFATKEYPEFENQIDNLILAFGMTSSEFVKTYILNENPQLEIF